MTTAEIFSCQNLVIFFIAGEQSSFKLLSIKIPIQYFLLKTCKL